MSREENVHLAKRAKMVASSQSISLKNQNTGQMSREDLVYLAKQARKVGRYEDMVELMEMVVKRCVDYSEDLTKEDKMLLSVAYKDVINASLYSLKSILFAEWKEESRGNEEKLSIINGYEGMIEFEITKQCILLIQNTEMSREENVLSILGKWLKNVTPSLSISSVNQMSREEIVYRAKLLKKAARYEDVVELMKQVVKMCAADSKELTKKEREILSAAYGNVRFSSLESLKGLSFIERKEEKLGNENHVSLIKCYKGMMESQLTEKCNVILDLVASSVACKVLYLEMKGDYFRSLAEFKTGAERDDAYQNSELAYQTARETRPAPPTYPYLPHGPVRQVKLSEFFKNALRGLKEGHCIGKIPELYYQDNPLGESH